jgi:hypothetical protein
MKKIRFGFLVELVAGVALTVIVCQPVLAG